MFARRIVSAASRLKLSCCTTPGSIATGSKENDPRTVKSNSHRGALVRM